MPDIVLTPLARDDLKEIALYTQKTWSVSQRDTYLSAFEAMLGRIAADKAHSRNRDTIRQGLLSCSCGKHVIFYRHLHSETIEVLRILHERMDFERYF